MSDVLNSIVAEPKEQLQLRARFFPIAALLLLAVATALRMYHLGDRSLWFDEALTANISKGTSQQILEVTRSRGSAPIIHPYLLSLVEKVARTAVAVRTPSVIASLLAVLMMLAMVRVRINQTAALFSAAILAVSASQVRYAQEVREYSLSVLCAATLIYCLLLWEATGSRGRHPALLYATLFLSPLIQYGLVFLAFGILATVSLRLLLTKDTSFRLAHLVIASASLAAGGLLSFFVTLRYQFHPGEVWYLAPYYYDSKAMSLWKFLMTNSYRLLSFFMPGRVIALLVVVCAPIYWIAQARARKYDTLTLLVFTTILMTASAAVLRLYPYGGVRQCLFLAPLLTILAGVVFADLTRRLGGFLQPVVIVGIMAIILLSGYRTVLRQWPYGEYEDIQSVLKELARSSAPNDQVWVNHDAVPAVEFYVQGKDSRFTYGNFHRDPQEYVPELLESIDPRSDRVWLVFSHLQQESDRAEERLIVNSLPSVWNVRPVITPINTALYLAHRTISPLKGLTRP